MICTPLGKACPKEFPMSSDWDDDKEEDQVKGENNDKDNEKKTPQTNQILCSDYLNSTDSQTLHH